MTVAKKRKAARRTSRAARRTSHVARGTPHVARGSPRVASPAPPRWNANPDDVRRSVIQLVLTLVEFIRRILERQAIRRLEGKTLTKKQTEDIGLALMKLEETIRDIAADFDLAPEDLNLDLGPIGKLL